MRRHTLSVLVAAILALALLLTWPITLRRDRPRGRAGATGIVAMGVRLGDRDIGGWQSNQVRNLLTTLATDANTAPIEPQLEDGKTTLVPGLEGKTVDVQATLEAVLAAPPDSRVNVVLRTTPPTRRLRDLPPAPLRHGNRGREAVAFEINVAWGNEFVEPLLRVLAARHVHATFCLVGRWAEENPELARAIAKAGHELCNHGYTDHTWADLGRDAAQRSIARADQTIEQITGRKPAWFSPHKGEWNPAVLAAARGLGHELVLWSRDTIDWQKPSVGKVLERTVGRAQPGDIILMHPTAVTAEAMAAMIDGLRAKGLEPVTIGELVEPWRVAPWRVAPPDGMAAEAANAEAGKG